LSASSLFSPQHFHHIQLHYVAIHILRYSTWLWDTTAT